MGSDDFINRKGRNNPNSKITQKDVNDIKSLYPDYTQEQIADVYSIDRTEVTRILKGERWKDD